MEDGTDSVVVRMVFPAKDREDGLGAVNVRIQRKRVTPEQRDFIWSSLKLCYLCKRTLNPKGDWHVEHVIALSDNPAENDVLGNMLPACPDCNSSKGSKSLVDIVRDRVFPTNLLTAAANVEHLNESASRTIREALGFKHGRCRSIDGFQPEILAQKILQMNEMLQNSTDHVLDPEAAKELFKSITQDTPCLTKDVIKLRKTVKVLGAGGNGEVVAAGLVRPGIENPLPVALKVLMSPPLKSRFLNSGFVRCSDFLA